MLPGCFENCFDGLLTDPVFAEVDLVSRTPFDVIVDGLVDMEQAGARD